MTKRLMLLEENQIAFHAEDGTIFNSVKDYTRQLAEMIGLGSDTELPQAGIRNILDINCGFGSFGAHLLSLKIMAVCIAAYEATGSQVQLSLERGLPAMIGNFISRQLPYPSLSYDMVHCAQCGIMWDEKNGMFLVEVDRVLKPGGYFVLTSPTSRPQGSSREKKRIMANPIEGLTQQLCWTLLAQQDETFIWQKTADIDCYASRCEPFPTYPRTYDMLHAYGLISHLSSERCSMVDLFLEMDRILRPEGWVILSDTIGAIEMARMLAAQVRWDARIIDLQNGSDQRLLVCQKPFVKK
ncbi:Putative methyltransferase PMT4 [Glycine soja]|uniref:Methyltransferase n=1 Tax=Glycine soja TaxID=3848 RepID=A0A0B2QLA3_GLYSO|nr:Putative methyltransferase PMT4 [Glycine soja]